MKIALSDVAFATVGNLGRIAEVQLERRDQPRDGNYLYGAFGGDFPTSDGRRVMVVTLTSRQWKALKEATGTEELLRPSSRRPATTSAAKRAATRVATSSVSS